MSPGPRPRKRGTVRKGWGSVARHGAREVSPEPDAPGLQRPRRKQPPREQGPPPAWTAEEWREEAPPVRRQASRAAARAASPTPNAPPKAVARELAAAVGERDAAASRRRLSDAVRAFERERFGDVTRLLRPLADRAPRVAPVHELLGLAFYRQGRWADAVRHLEVFHSLTGAYEHHPVLADSHRALGDWDRVEYLWEELRAASPGAEIVSEGRIVAAGALADRGEVRAAIRLLRKGAEPARPKWFHLRLWYALADLYERVGDVPRARELFTRILERDPAFADVGERVDALA
jgi:tetratricopeptide (TPR) repeat protein